METALQLRPLAVTKTLNVERRLEIFKKTAGDVKLALKHEVTNYDQEAQATVLATQLKNDRKAIEEDRKAANKEPDEFIKANNAQCKPVLTACDGAIEHLNTQRSTFQRAEEKKKREEEAKARAEQERRQKISIAQGGDGSNIKPVPLVIDQHKLKATSKGRRIPDYEKIQTVIDQSAKKLTLPVPIEIEGVEIYAVWKFTIIDAAAVPDEFKKTSFVDR